MAQFKDLEMQSLLKIENSHQNKSHVSVFHYFLLNNELLLFLVKILFYKMYMKENLTSLKKIIS